MFDGLWIPPEYLAQLPAQQVLDQDPLSGQTVMFAGVQGNVAVVVSGGPGDQLETHYDVGDGAAGVRPLPPR